MMRNLELKFNLFNYIQDENTKEVAREYSDCIINKKNPKNPYVKIFVLYDANLGKNYFVVAKFNLLKKILKKERKIKKKFIQYLQRDVDTWWRFIPIREEYIIAGINNKLEEMNINYIID